MPKADLCGLELRKKFFTRIAACPLKNTGAESDNAA